MAHSDDNGLVLPPKIAPYHIIILPILHKEETKEAVLQYVEKLKNSLEEKHYHGRNIEVFVDTRDKRGGEKKWEWIKKGAPLLLEVGPRDIEQDSLCVEKRTALKEVQKIPRQEFIENCALILDNMQKSLWEKAKDYQTLHTKEINSKEEFIRFFTPKNAEKPEIHGGFAMVHWAGNSQDEEQIKTEYGVTLRCIPLEGKNEKGICPFTGKESHKRVLFAKAY
jgi:prolyl-tRNA synthetase